MLHGPRQSRLSHPHHVIGVEWCDLLSPHANTSLGRSIRVSINIDQDLKPCMEDERTIKLPKSHAMNGGDENYSYGQNSSYQGGSGCCKGIINEGVASKLDLKLLSSSSTINPFRIADFGCSTGPNTLLAMQIIVEAEEQKFKSEKPTTNSEMKKGVEIIQNLVTEEKPELVVGFSDLNFCSSASTMICIARSVLGPVETTKICYAKWVYGGR
ncbi:unnamed protein product [Ilex paraguariensis]|uniref:Uncharacterized protein n=1 Tax=Ilex paraguariensis TaxID=185542 RepID=A0ABC8V3W2_9AQUA